MLCFPTVKIIGKDLLQIVVFSVGLELGTFQMHENPTRRHFSRSELQNSEGRSYFVKEKLACPCFLID